MRTFNIREAKTQLSRLVELAAKVMPLDAPDAGQVKRLGFISARLPCPTTSIGWEAAISSSPSAAQAEIPPGQRGQRAGADGLNLCKPGTNGSGKDSIVAIRSHCDQHG